MNKGVFIKIEHKGNVNGNPHFDVTHRGDEDDLFIMACALMELPNIKAAITEAIFENSISCRDNVN